MKPEEKRTFLISASMIIILSLISFYRLQNFDSSNMSTPFPEAEKINVPDIDNLFSEEKIEDFRKEMGISLDESEIKYIRHEIDGKIQLDYPSHWETIDSESTTEEVDVIFTAVYRDFINPKVLTAFTINTNNIDVVSDLIQKELEKESDKIKILTEITDDGSYVFLSESVGSQNMTSITKGKVFFIEDIAYMIILNFFKEQENSFPALDYIISSIKLID